MRLRQIAFSVPAQRYSSEEVAGWAGLDPGFVRDKIGIESRAFLGPDETPLSLSVQACEALFASAPDLAPSRVGLLIVVTQNPDYRLPHSSALLQKALGLGTAVACFDINLGCSGYVYALSVARAFMLTEGIEDALVVTCDPYSRIMGRADRDTIALFGDAASATWMCAHQGGELGKLDFGTDGGGAEHLIVHAGGAAQPLSAVHGEQLSQRPDRDYRLTMQGRGIFNFMMERIPTTIERCLAKNAVTRESIDLFVFHQASRFLLETLRKKLSLETSRVPVNLTHVGNTVSSSIPILLAELADRGALKGKRVLVSGFGVGLSWATNLIQFQG